MSVHTDLATPRPSRASGILVAIAAGLMTGACSSSGALESLDGLLGSQQQPTATSSASGGATVAAGPKTELDKALEYWGEQYKKQPHDLKTALAYAKNLKAAGHKEQAFGIMQGVSIMHGESKELASEMGRLAVEFDQIAIAEKLLAIADDPLKPDWRVISARGAVLAKQSKFAEAIPMFERALKVSPNQPSVMNNLAMAHAASGDPATAEAILRKAAAGGNDPKIRQNLALVLGLQGKHDEAGSVRASHVQVASAAADTDYIKRMVKATPETSPAAATPAINDQPQARPQPPARPRVIEATAAGKPANGEGLRPAAGPSDVSPPAGSWSTSVSVAR